MSLATRCTTCGTIFRVVQDQLKVSEGWVRCGRCQEVFNALEGLFDLEREAPPQRKPTASQAVAQSMAEFVASHHGRSPPPDEDDAMPSTAEDDAIESRFLERRGGHAATDAAHDDFEDARFPSELPLEPASPPTATPGPTLESSAVAKRLSLAERRKQRRDARESAALSAWLEADTAEAAAALAAGSAPRRGSPTPEFVRQAERAAQWQRPRVRASLAVAALLLTGMLLTQIALQFRDAFAAQWPQARPTLEALCELLDCHIEPLRRLSALSVEASGLTQVDGQQAYRLSLSLRNRGRVEIALPSVDLSLTDGSGALIARRALAPAAFRAAPGDAAPTVPLPPGGEAQWQALLTTPNMRISGYTVELFYP